ncbi:MAG: hypothetical protein ACTSXZ_05685, partial [Alphaproteobacteria bacterium]
TQKRTYKDVQAAFLLDAVAKAEKVEVSDEEVEAEIQQIAEQQNRPVEQVSAFYQKEDAMDSLREQIKEKKVLDFLFDSAKVTWEEAKEEKSEEEQATEEQPEDKEEPSPDEEKTEES